jgi:hypothetical protein
VNDWNLERPRLEPFTVNCFSQTKTCFESFVSYRVQLCPKKNALYNLHVDPDPDPIQTSSPRPLPSYVFILLRAAQPLSIDSLSCIRRRLYSFVPSINHFAISPSFSLSPIPPSNHFRFPAFATFSPSCSTPCQPP